MFCIAGLLGGAIYVCATYSNLGVEGHRVPAGVILGWTGDILFLPSIAALLPLFLCYIPRGEWPKGGWPWMVVIASVISCVCLVAAGVLEPHIVGHASDVHSPLGTPLSSEAWTRLQGFGLLTFLLALLLTTPVVVKRLSTLDAAYDETKWFLYGAVAGVVALLPFLAGSTFSIPFAPRRIDAVTRSWGAVFAAALPLAAVPAVRGVKWQHGRMKRLVRGVLIASIVTIVHEMFVISVADSVLSGVGAAKEHVNGGIALTYGITLAVALFIEPVAQAFHRMFEWVLRRKDPPQDLIEEALDDLKDSKKSLTRATLKGEKAARTAWGAARQARKRARAAQVIADIKAESANAARAIEGLEEIIREWGSNQSPDSKSAMPPEDFNADQPASKATANVPRSG